MGDDKVWHILELDSLNPAISRRTRHRVWMDGNIARDENDREVAVRGDDGRWNVMGSPNWGRLTREATRLPGRKS